MSYATRPMGDYKTYGYAGRAGDPGFLSGLWKIAKKVAGPIIGGMLGGPIGAAIGTGVGGVRTPPILPPPPGQIGVGVSFPGGTQVVGQFAPVLPGRAARGMVAAPGAACPTGYHLAKDGSGRWVRNRRMNVANPRALRKAMRRVQGFEKLAKRTIQFTRRVKMKKHG